MKAMIFAAGLGTRLRPLTNDKPKALVEIKGKTLLEITIDKMISSGFDEIIINVHHFAEQVKSFLRDKNFDASIQVSDESNALLDTGGGLKNAQWFFDDGKPFLIHNVDIISDLDLKDFYETHLKNNSIATLAVKDRESSRKFLFDSNDELCGWRNIKSGEEKLSRKTTEINELAFSGIQIVHPAIFKYFPWQAVFSLVDLYLEASKTEKIKAFRHDNSFWQDVGRIEDLEKLT